jgi:lysyl endopeptidase
MSRIHSKFAAAAFVFANAFVMQAAQAALPFIQGEAARSEKSGKTKAEMNLATVSTASAAMVRLAPVNAAALQRAEMQSANGAKHKQIGLARDIAAEAGNIDRFAPEWTTLPDGSHVARFGMHAIGARALRLGLVFGNLPESAVLRVRGNEQSAVQATNGTDIHAAQMASGLFWSPVTDGERQDAELHVAAGVDYRGITINVAHASHLFANSKDQFKAKTGPGAAATCHEDVTCISSPSEAFKNASRAVARMVYTKNGSTYVCTGTLVNDNDNASQVPYLLTAAHCIDSQATAGTLNTFWFFEASLCRSQSAGQYTQLSGGARVLFSNSASDVALLRLNERAPQGAYFSGWDPNPLAANASVITLHHPSGDLKKVSSGTVLDAAQAGVSGNQQAVSWLSGSTEPGSSGSGLFTLQGNEYLVRGSLRGGSGSCTSSGNLADPSNRDYFSRLDGDYQRLKEILAAGPAPMEDYTDIWGTPGEAGWGVSIVQHANNKIVAIWFTYDNEGRAVWMAMTGGAWKSVSEFESPVYRTTGPSFAKSFDANQVNLQQIGTATLRFSADGTATFSTTVNGVAQVKTLARFAY